MHEPSSVENAFEFIEQGLEDKTARIAIVGLGYVGLPLALEYAAAGFDTIGLDLNEERVEALMAGESYIGDISHDMVSSAVQSGLFRATTGSDECQDAQVIFICVPTPVTRHKDPDISYVEAAARSIGETLRKGQLIILKSTTYPNTTEGVVLPILKVTADLKGLNLGKDYFLAFSPERIDPGNPSFTTSNTTVVVGGVTPQCTHLASASLQQIIKTVHVVSSPRVAEMEKLLENIFRSVNIALVNELARLCDRMGGISMWEVIEAAATKPFGFMPFFPGPGLGGHCIPIDPYYLSWLAREYDFETSFITLSARINEEMPFYVTDAIIRAVARQSTLLSEVKVLILGVAFKKNVGDTRHSPAQKVIELLNKKGIPQVTYNDPFVPTLSVRNGAETVILHSTTLTKSLLKSHHITVIMTDHSDYDYELVAKYSPMIVDTRNALKDVSISADNLMLLGGGDF